MRHTACEKCGSSDGNAVYDDGGTYCFVCHVSTGGKHFPEEMSQRDWSGTLNEISKLKSGNLLARGIDAKYAEKYGVRIEYNGEGEQVAFYAPLYRDGTVAGYQKKLSNAPGGRGKQSVCRIGETGGTDPFGSQVVGMGGKMLIVTEGMEDCLAAYQMLNELGKNYRVVASLGTDAWQRNIAYYEGFEKVVICFDPDGPGKEAATDFADALTHGKAHIIQLPEGLDPNQMLIERQGREFLSRLNSARAYEPQGIISGKEMWNLMQGYVEPTYIPYPEEMKDLRAKMDGMREGEISTWIAGTSAGKTSYVRRLKQWALTNKASDGTYWGIGEAELEEGPEKTGRGLMEFHAGKRWKIMSADERRKTWEETYGTGRIITLGKGRRNKKTKSSLVNKFRHLHYDKGCRLFFLDHITLGVREFGSGSGTLDDQDSMMEEFLDFVESTKSHICLISHLRKPPGGGKTWSQGAIPSEEDMKGSGSLYQVSFDIIGLSRNKQHENEYERNVSQLHVLKCRETGRTGPADRMYWDDKQSALIPAMDAISDGDEPPL